MNHISKALVILCLEATLIGQSQAALIDRGGGLIYDTDINVTWLQDAGYARTTGYTGDGVYVDNTNYGQIMRWQAAYDWAYNLSYYDAVRNVTYNDWRLPKPFLPHPTEPTCFGSNCVKAELGHLWYVELNNVYLNGAMTTRNGGPFVNTEYLYSIWTETIDFGPYAYAFHWPDGEVRVDHRESVYGTAWAVRDGDVAQRIQNVGEPGSLLLAGLALLGLVVSISKRRVHVTAIAHINVMRQDLGLLRKLDSEDRYPIFWATVGEFSAAA